MMHLARLIQTVEPLESRWKWTYSGVKIGEDLGFRCWRRHEHAPRLPNAKRRVHVIGGEVFHRELPHTDGSSTALPHRCKIPMSFGFHRKLRGVSRHLNVTKVNPAFAITARTPSCTSHLAVWAQNSSGNLYLETLGDRCSIVAPHFRTNMRVALELTYRSVHPECKWFRSRVERISERKRRKEKKPQLLETRRPI